MALPSRRSLRARFDDAEHPAPQRPPQTHHRKWYLATDGSMRDRQGRLGAVLESADGARTGCWSHPYRAVDNNAAELAALHFGLDLAATYVQPDDRLGVLLDHDALARGVATCVTPSVPTPRRPPCGSGSIHHWGGITARLATMGSVRVGLVDSFENPAHGTANVRGSLAEPSGGHT